MRSLIINYNLKENRMFNVYVKQNEYIIKINNKNKIIVKQLINLMYLVNAFVLARKI